MIHRDPNQVTCNEKKRQITGWRLGGRVGVEAALKRLRIAECATRGKAGWIAEASSHYFTKITNSFRVPARRRQTEGLTAPMQHRASIYAGAIVSRLIVDDPAPSIRKSMPRATARSPKPKPIKASPR
ncbi:hypothetical protein [Burkholderia territorii]|uniref:hypothetical protein n=1 Tax=Burkholderia territorii TaxID=1503055 RepID=UPI0012D8E59A|nr:hypothetical protein [Burkholderia territorii]